MSIKSRFLVALLLIAGGGATYYVRVYLPRHRALGELAYVLPGSLAMVTTPAEVRQVVATLKSGDRVEVLARTRSWMRVRAPGGPTGWVESKDMLDAETYGRGQRLLKELSSPPQARGHCETLVNLHLEPSRDAPLLGELGNNQKVDIFERRLVERSSQPDDPRGEATRRDAWYLVRADSRAGWILGRLVELDVPESLAPYAQGTNMVAWLVLTTVTDQGREAPEYLVADRLGAQDLDFNHIRVFTWWKKRHHYVTAYVEGHLNGYFPLRAMRVNNTPYFRLRLMDASGRQYQKVYEMSDTIVRRVGVVEGWESDAMPQSRKASAPKPVRTRRARHHGRRGA
ncbi:MAG: hypothetical protein DMG25_08340 [Acidobacteria bacterium]|nr:MAG: hypothetical protein DMG25_08340 [Acidobacteriota bacterium]